MRFVPPASWRGSPSAAPRHPRGPLTAVPRWALQEEGLKKLFKQIPERRPQWLVRAKREHGGLPCPLESCRPSPVLESYRNKCEFTVGRDGDGKVRTSVPLPPAKLRFRFTAVPRACQQQLYNEQRCFVASSPFRSFDRARGALSLLRRAPGRPPLASRWGRTAMASSPWRGPSGAATFPTRQRLPSPPFKRLWRHHPCGRTTASTTRAPSARSSSATQRRATAS